MIIFCTIFFAILLFPIYTHVDIFFNKSCKKAYVNVNLYKFLKIFGGYFSLYKGGVALHLNDRKAILFPYKNIFDIRNKVEPLKDYHIKKINFRLDVGYRNCQEISIYLPFVYVWHNELLGNVLSQVKPYLDYENSLYVYENDNRFNIFLEITTIFNLLMVLISLVKISMEKLLNAFK